MKDRQANFELMEPTSPETLVPDAWVEPWMIVTGALLLLLIAAWWMFRKKKPAEIDSQAIRNAAYRDALAGLENIQPSRARDTAVQSSLVLRKYLSIAAGDPALYETHEEFISRHDALNALTEAARKVTESGFTRLAALKYSAEPPDVSPQEVVGDSRALLETFHHGFHA